MLTTGGLGGAAVHAYDAEPAERSEEGEAGLEAAPPGSGETATMSTGRRPVSFAEGRRSEASR